MAQERLMRHAARCWGFVVDGKVDQQGGGWVYHRLVDMYSEQGRFDEAEKMYVRAGAGGEGEEKAWGPEHTSTLNTVNNLGALYAILGRLDKVEKMYSWALPGYEKAFGPERVERYVPALNTVCNLGNFLRKQKQPAHARQVFQKALATFQVVLGMSCAQCQQLERGIVSLDEEF